MDKSIIESMKVKGLTYLGCVEGEGVFCNLESKSSIKKCLVYLENLTGEEWKTFRETKGNKNLVFYKASMFKVQKGDLRFKGGSSVELPLNCSSCYSMFYECELPEGFTLGDNFDTSRVVDMSIMFYSCKMPKGFTLGDKFDTSKVEDMSSMFAKCCMPKGFTLGDKFDTSNVKHMYNMFSDCILPEGFTLGDKFDTSNVWYVYHMFSNCKMPDDFTLGDLFSISNAKNTDNMFFASTLPEGKKAEDFNSEFKIVEWLKSRSSGKTVAGSLKEVAAF